MRMLAEEQLCGGYVRYLPVTKIDGEMKRRALERFVEYRNRGVIRECGFADDIWNVTDELSRHQIDFGIDREAYGKKSLQWIGCTADCYRECMKAYASMLLGELTLAGIQIVVKDLARMAGNTAEEAARESTGNSIHRAAFLAMIPLGNDLRDQVIEEMENRRCGNRRDNARDNARTLPEFRYYLRFDRAMKEYWASAEDGKKQICFPVFFWWNLTAVLPLRATEFLMTPRECLSEEQGKYMLTIRRTRMKKGRRHSYKIQEDFEGHSYCIPQAMYQEIDWYRKATSAGKVPEIGTLLVPDRDVPSGYFTYCQMQRRLKRFCHEVLGDEDYPVHMGDTRHLAMVSLILSGGSPVICRELAGHEDIDISSHYYSNMSGVVESMVLERFRGWNTESAIGGENRYCVSVPSERVWVKNGWCDYKDITGGDVSECIRAYVPGGEIGDCLSCWHYYPDRKGLQLKIEETAKKAVDDDGVFLMQMIELVRKSLGYGEDIDQALLRIRGSADRYAKLLMRNYREEK